MSAQTAAQKILARASGKARVAVGEVVHPEPELVIVHDGYVETAHRELSSLGFGRIRNPERTVFVTDHEVAYGSPRAIDRGLNIRRIARSWRVGRFFDVGRGGHGHLFPMEMGLIKPGMFLFAYDMHATNFGAIGALAMAVSTEITSVLATGSVWLPVPASIRVNLGGAWRAGVHGRDLGFLLASGLKSGRYGANADYRVIEFAGEELGSMPLATRVALCNSVTEIGVANVLFPPYRDALASSPYADIRSDSNAPYEAVVDIDLATIEPQVALPGGPENAAPVSVAAGQRIDHAFIGACGSGMYDDFASAATLMRGRRVAEGVRMFIVPGTVETARRLADDGISQAFLDAGAIMLPPGCGPCAGGLMAPLGPSEVSISTAATNHAGRFGAKEGQAYLGSPLTVSASAVAGHITDPREMLARHG